MGGEDQLKALVRHGFALRNVADKTVVDMDGLLAQAMANVKWLIEQLPEESLLRAQSWKQLQPLVQSELKVYSDQFGRALTDALVDAAPDMEKAAVRQAQLGGADFGPEYITLNPAGGRVADTVEMALRTQVTQVSLRKLFNVDGRTQQSAIEKALFRTVDTRVRAGMIEGLTTDEIAKQMIGEVQRAGIPGVDINSGQVSRQVRNQAMAIARTATQDMARQVKEQVYNANPEAMADMVWLWSAALDSKTCETCGPLDGRRWPKQKDAPRWPVHPNCRCQLLPIDPDDDFWDNPEITAQQIRPVEKGRYEGKGAYKTPITVKGKRYFRKAIPVTSDTPPPRYSDVLAKWATSSQESLRVALGRSRADHFIREYNKLNKDPQQILESMLTGKPGAQKWIPVEKLKPVRQRVAVAKSKPASLSPEQKAAQKAALFQQREAARKKARELKQKAEAQINSAELDRALSAAAKPVVKAPVTVKWSSLDGVDPVPLFEKSGDTLGRGFMGVAKMTPKGVAKQGRISRSEVEALKLLKGAGVTPEFLGVTYEAGTKFQTYLGLVPARKGTLLMTTAPGRPLVKVGKLQGAEALDAFDQFIGARKTIHLKGIAHHDMHLGNVLWDQKAKKLTVIDLGVARIDPRSALIEALGSRRGLINFGKVEKPGDYQSVNTWRWMNPRNGSANKSERWKRFAANRKKVEAILKADGLGDEFSNASIRKLPRAISSAVSKERAMELLQMLYEGV